MQLRVRTGPGRGNTYVIDAPVIKIGRAVRPGERVPGWISLNDDTVSRLHCEIFWQEEKSNFRLVHRSTTNSTYVNDEEVIEETEISVDDVIEMGATALELQKADLRWSKAAEDSGSWQSPSDPTIRVEQQAPRRIPGAFVSAAPPSTRRLTIGPQLHYTMSTADGQDYPLEGKMVRFGSADAPATDGDPPLIRFDTEYPLEGEFSYYNLILKYDELTQTYKAAWVGPKAAIVRIFRQQNELIWQTDLPEAYELPLQLEDRLQVGPYLLIYRKRVIDEQ